MEVEEFVPGWGWVEFGGIWMEFGGNLDGSLTYKTVNCSDLHIKYTGNGQVLAQFNKRWLSCNKTANDALEHDYR
jgi:hypothetical protein